ncbi:hypothetical protein [Blautia obeum]|uniref:hypothetical protein n=1 Tax=Blautia obeum TaxID=40520 RepID=UPI000E42FBCC|nr:hypothetical protein [Blautia obeum]RGI92315.1 hypothetical protein DXD81_09125 [Blautia obeum]
MNEFYMEETDDMENELDNLELYLDQEPDYLDEEDEWVEDEIWEEADEEDELTEAEEIELVKAITSIIDAAESILVGMQRKVFELNETQDIEMRNDIIELEDGEKHLIVSAFLPDSENPDYGYYIPMKSEKIEPEKKTLKKGRPLPKFWKYTHGISYSKNGKFKSAEDMRKQRENQKNRMDDSLICPMNALIDMIDEYTHTKLTKKAMFGDKPAIQMEDFLAKVDGRADSRQINKVLEWAKEWKAAAREYNLKMFSAADKYDLGAYVNLLEKQEKIKTDMKRSIRKMDRKTMSQMIRFAIKAGDKIGIPGGLRENYRKFGMEVMQLCYDYNKKMFLSCFKTSAEMKEEEARAEQQTAKVTKFPKKVRRSMNKTRRKVI